MDSAFESAWRASWQAIHARAWWSLNHGASLPPSVSRGRLFHGLPRLRLWDDAEGFGCESEPTTLTVYELFTDAGGREPVVREVMWRRSQDLQRLQQEINRTGQVVACEPSLAVRDAAVPAKPLAALLAEAAAFRVPVAWFADTEAVTSDVGGRGFAFYSRDQPPAVLQLEWSSDTPPEWAPVMEWCERLRRFLVGCLAEALDRA